MVLEDAIAIEIIDVTIDVIATTDAIHITIAEETIGMVVMTDIRLIN